mmetsp:Transcript_6548/g.17772  ORF Transcript_6548/g.17772 Transcript_6548/m.17772 type:complete len:91 (+) Transcript_6548:68-340(+)
MSVATPPPSASRDSPIGATQFADVLSEHKQFCERAYSPSRLSAITPLARRPSGLVSGPKALDRSHSTSASSLAVVRRPQLSLKVERQCTA